MANEVFISYSRSDYQKVRKIKETIDGEVGIDCWMDLDGIESDKQFLDVIIHAINNHDTVLFMMSKESMRSKWALDELAFAEKKHKRIVLVRLDKAEMPDKFYFLYHGKDQIEWINVGQRRKLIKNLRSWCQPDEDDRPARLSTFAIPEGARGATVMIDLGDTTTESIYTYEGGKAKKVSERKINTIPAVEDDDEPVVSSSSPFITDKQPTQPPKTPDLKSLINRKYFKWIYGTVLLSILAICTIFIGSSIYNRHSTGYLIAVNDTFPDDYYQRFQNEQGLWGFSSPSGELLIECKWKGVNTFSEGLAPVRDVQSNLCGYINKSDSLVIPYKWNVAGLFSEGLAKVKLNNKWGFIDREGNEIIPCAIPNEPTDFQNGEARYDYTDDSFPAEIDSMVIDGDFYISEGVIMKVVIVDDTDS